MTGTSPVAFLHAEHRGRLRMSGALEQLAKPQLADSQGLVPHVDAVVGEKVEGVQPYVGIALSIVQGIKIGDPILPEDDCFND